MSYQIRVKKTELLQQKARLAERQADLLRDRLAAAEALLSEHEAEAECPDCDMKALERRRDYLEHRAEIELKANTALCGKKLESRACEAKKTALLCQLQELQRWKLNLAEAELAEVVSQIWRCRTQGFEDCIDDLMCKIDAQVKACPDDVDPYLADAINNTLKDC